MDSHLEPPPKHFHFRNRLSNSTVNSTVNSAVDILPPYTSSELPPPSFVSKASSEHSTSSEPNRIRLGINVSTSITRVVSANPQHALQKQAHVNVKAVSATPWDDPFGETSSGSNGINSLTSEPESVETLIAHTTTRAALYQLSAPLSARPESLTISRYTPTQERKEANFYLSDHPALRAKTTPLYTLNTIPAPLNGRPQVNRCEIRSHRSTGSSRTGVVSLGLDLHGFTTTITFAGKKVLHFSHNKWKDDKGVVVALTEKHKEQGDKVPEVEFPVGVDEGTRDLVVAGWIAGIWLRTLVPKLDLKGGTASKSASDATAADKWKWRQKEKFPMRDEAVMAEWKASNAETQKGHRDDLSRQFG